jgi:hypothetical protein
LVAGVLLVGSVLSVPAGAVARPSSARSAANKPGAICGADKLGRKAKDGKLILICKKVSKHDRWEVFTAVKKTGVKGPTVAQVKKSFAADVDPAESTMKTVLAKAEAPGFKLTPANVASLAAPLIAACQKMDTELSALHATGTIGSEIQAYVAQDRVIVGILQSAGTQTSVTILAWAKTLQKNAQILKQDSTVLRSALGLPPAF